jgi:hypothetical protein
MTLRDCTLDTYLITLHQEHIIVVTEYPMTGPLHVRTLRHVSLYNALYIVNTLRVVGREIMVRFTNGSRGVSLLRKEQNRLRGPWCLIKSVPGPFPRSKAAEPRSLSLNLI